MRGIFAAGGNEHTWAHVSAIMGDPRIIARDGDLSRTRIPAPAEEVPFTLVVPVDAIEWTLWDFIYGINHLRYKNARLLFVVSRPDLNDKTMSIVKEHQKYLPDVDIFAPKRSLSAPDLLNVALSSVPTDYFCTVHPQDHIHPSALLAMSEAILKTNADFYHTSRYKLMPNHFAYCTPDLHDDDPWSGVSFQYRGLFTFRKRAIVELGGFADGTSTVDPITAMIYALLDADCRIERVPEYLYLSRDTGYPKPSRSPRGHEWRKKLIAECWPRRVKE